MTPYRLGGDIEPAQEDLEAAESIYNHIMDCSHYLRQSAALKEMFGPKAELKFAGNNGLYDKMTIDSIPAVYVTQLLNAYRRREDNDIKQIVFFAKVYELNFDNLMDKLHKINENNSKSSS